MRIATLDGRAVLVFGDRALDIETASGGVFGADVADLYDRWDELRSWADTVDAAADREIAADRLGCPTPRPRQIFAIGLNYRSHAVESGLPIPGIPVVFTKFPASVTGPYDVVPLPEGPVDFEAELVAVVGRRAEDVTVADAWEHIAGITVGQDLSQRATQWAGGAPQQFNLGKSYTGFTPVGPMVVTPDEFADPDDIGISCALNGVEMQRSSTADLIFSVPQLVAYLSAIVPLLPGDLIFTGTPEGIGFTRDPKVLLEPGDELVTGVDGVGEMRNTFVWKKVRSDVG